MKLKHVLFSIFFIIPIISYGQTIDADEVNGVYGPEMDFYAENYTGTASVGKGFTGVAAFSGIEGITLNPASLKIPNKYQLYYEFGSKNKVRYMPDFYNDENEYLFFDDKDINMSQHKGITSFGIGFNINEKLQTGLLFANTENIYYDSIEWGIMDYYGTIVDSVDTFFEKRCTKLLIPISYKLSESFQMGLSMDFEIYKSKEWGVIFFNNGNHRIIFPEADFVIIRPKLGMIYQSKGKFTFGASFLPTSSKSIVASDREYKVKYDKNAFPFEFRCGLAYKWKTMPLSMHFDFRHIHTAEYKPFDNRNDFFTGLEYKLEKVIFRTGYFSSFEYRNLSYQMQDDDGNEFDYWIDTTAHDLHYVTLGISYLWKRITFSGAYLTSSILSPNEEKQTSLNISLSLNL